MLGEGVRSSLANKDPDGRRKPDRTATADIGFYRG